MAEQKTVLLGLIINPIAGMGGVVGLKGSDGEIILEEARKRGAEPQAERRAREFLHELRGLKTKITIVTVSGAMGGNIAQEEGFQCRILDDQSLPTDAKLYKTKPDHTIKAAQLLKDAGVTLITFVGGDGTARNIFEAVQQEIPCLGIPGGVKIHSSVFALNPRTAGLLTLQFLWGEAPLRESEVMDINEDAFRDNRVISKLYGYLVTPYSPTYSQPSKMASPRTEDELDNQNRIAEWVVEEMDSADGDWYYLLGPGTTPRAIANFVKEEKTLLGVDLFHNKKRIAADLNEQQLLEALKGKQAKLVVTPIGAQGFIFGRGNLQLSPKVISVLGLENIIIIATKYKISTLPNQKLRIDSRDPEFDAKFIGFYRVLVDYG